MKWFYVIGLSTMALFALKAVAAEAPVPPQLAGVQTVYILPMGSGMDQFLASRLTAMHVVQVAADPQIADAIFTDHLGESFERRLEDLYPKPKPAPAVDEDKDAADKDTDKDKDEDAKTTDKDAVKEPVERPSVARANALATEEKSTAPISTFGRGRGTFFLVDRKTRNVLWSTYEKPAGSRPDQLRHTADVIAKEFKNARTGK